MKKILAIAAIAALTTGWSQVSHAQTATTASQATGVAGAAARADGGSGIGTLNIGGNGGGNNGQPGVGYLNTSVNGTVWTLGSTPSMNATQYDACTKYFSIAGPGAGLNIPLEIDMCWKMRQADAIAKYPPGSVQYNLMCADSGILQNDWDTGQIACSANKAKMRKSSPNDPRGIATTAVPVVAVGGYGVGQNLQPVPNAPPPTVVPVPVAPVNRAAVPADRTSPAAQQVANVDWTPPSNCTQHPANGMLICK